MSFSLELAMRCDRSTRVVCMAPEYVGGSFPSGRTKSVASTSRTNFCCLRSYTAQHGVMSATHPETWHMPTGFEAGSQKLRRPSSSEGRETPSIRLQEQGNKGTGTIV